MYVQQNQNITNTDFKLFSFPRSANPNMSSFGYKNRHYLTS